MFGFEEERKWACELVLLEDYEDKQKAYQMFDYSYLTYHGFLYPYKKTIEG